MVLGPDETFQRRLQIGAGLRHRIALRRITGLVALA
jgi:hypothetical protein